MSTTLSPKDVIVDFLRANLIDPRARAEASNTEEFDGGGTDFTLSAPSGSVSAVTSLTVNGTAQVKWQDYRYEQQNQKVIFFSNTAGGTDNVDITYKYGTSNWIYPDKVLTTLGSTSFPRVNLLVVDGTGDRLGSVRSDVQSTVIYQVDVWAKEDNIFTIDSIKYAGDKLAEQIGLKLIKAFRESAEDLHPPMFNYKPGYLRDLPFDTELQAHHKVFELEMNSINIGEI
jgi:hypothetical protein